MKKLLGVIAGILFSVGGIAVIIIGINQEKRCTVEAVGTVVEIEHKMTTDTEDGITRTDYIYYPVIQYQAGEKTVTKKSSEGSNNSSDYWVNKKVNIKYNPNNVEEYTIKGSPTINIVGIVFIIGGAIIVFSAITGKNLIDERKLVR